MNKRLKLYQYTLTTLSPVHIGTQDVYLPTNFVICNKSGHKEAQSKAICPDCGRKMINGECGSCGYVLEETESVQASVAEEYEMHVFTPRQLKQILSFADWENLKKISQASKMESIHMFFINRASQIGEKTPFQASVSKEVYKSYNDYITDRQKRNNQFNIEKQFQNPLTNKPVIPGSSLKGSIVTAWLNALASTQQNYNPNNKKERDALKRIEEKIKKENKVSDVFQKLKISDAELSSETTMRIVQPTMNHRNKVPQKKNSSKLSILEIIPRGAVFKGTITIAEEEQDSFWAKLQSTSNQFFKKELKIEEDDTRFVYNEFYENLQRKLRPSDCLLRIGTHSGSACVTIASLRCIQSRSKENKTVWKKEAGTFWSCEKEPFGWIKIEVSEQK